MRTRRLTILVLASLLLAATLSTTPTGRAQAPAAPGAIYLPIVAAPIVPSLLAPADEAHVVSLAPLLTWDTPITGTYQIQIAADPTFAEPSTFAFSETKTLHQGETGSQTTLITSNLASKTTFYWRIGLRSAAGGYRYATRSFTTPAKDSALLPGPVALIAPANQAALPGNSVTLQWQPVPGALYYRVRVSLAGGALFSPGSKDPAAPSSSLAVAGLQPGATYTWKVKALNAYGWGEYSPIYSFSVP